MRTSSVIKGILVAAAAAAPMLSYADSQGTSGAGALSANAHVNFTITIPKFVYLSVGNTGAVDMITFTPAATVIGNGAAQNGTGGDQTGGTETAVVISNGGTVTLASHALGALSDGAGDTISYSQIKTTASANTTGTVLAAPTLADTGNPSVTLTPVGKIVQQDAKWQYTYLNTTVPAPGTYGVSVANNGQVTYTASVL
jgi:hypothetical protein